MVAVALLWKSCLYLAERHDKDTSHMPLKVLLRPTFQNPLWKHSDKCCSIPTHEGIKHGSGLQWRAQASVPSLGVFDSLQAQAFLGSLDESLANPSVPISANLRA